MLISKELEVILNKVTTGEMVIIPLRFHDEMNNWFHQVVTAFVMSSSCPFVCGLYPHSIDTHNIDVTSDEIEMCVVFKSVDDIKGDHKKHVLGCIDMALTNLTTEQADHIASYLNS